MSLRILDGDIEVSPTSRTHTPFLYEENEFQSIDEDSRSLSNRNSQINLDRLSMTGLELQKYDEGLKNLNITLDPREFTSDISDEKVTNTLKIDSEEKSPAVDIKDARGRDLDHSINSNYNPVNRIESLLEEDFEIKLMECDNNFVQEISRLCDRFEGRPLPQNLVKCVVSLTTPRDVLSTSPLEPPSFIEFDMSEDGFACLFVPALTPQVVHSEYICYSSLRYFIIVPALTLLVVYCEYQH